MIASSPADDVQPAPAGKPKNIVLFSDGTNNAAASANKTNVWRLYKATDLGVPKKGERTQIGRYDNGVGTSTFRPFAILGGIFGIGVKANILSLYRFLCRNYRPADDAAGREADHIYAFGFSRGAFTIRALIGLIDQQGLVPYTTEADLDYQVADAYRAYRRAQRPRMLPMRWLVPVWKWLLEALITAKRRLFKQVVYDRRANHRGVTVDFVGVWDTVAAYGGPIVELVRAFDDWIMPITLTNQSLPDCVQVARHALAIDDERDSFQPLPWDESSAIPESRLKQVWFAGMHSDVGGGYPDDALAYVPLLWMMDEAQGCGLRLFANDLAETKRQADAFGPIHDSRSGPAGYYRYQPRKIGAYIEPPEPGSALYRDPDEPEHQGLRDQVLVHDSVFCRILNGTDGYAPITLPHHFRVVSDRSSTVSALPATIARRLTTPAVNDSRARKQSAIWDWVWARRIVYFTLVGASLLLATMPIWPEIGEDRSAAGFGGLLRIPFAWLETFTPGFVSPWLGAFRLHPGISALLIIAIAMLFRASAWLERGLRDRTRHLWHFVLHGTPANGLPENTALERFRTGAGYQAVARVLKWYLLPSLFGIAGLTLLTLGVFAVLTQVRLSFGERGTLFCPASRATAVATGPNFSTARSCNPLPLSVEKGRTYEVEFEVRTLWKDGGRPATPEGLSVGKLMPYHLDALFLGFRRAVGARWMQPLLYIRPHSDDFRATPVHIEPLDLSPASGDSVYRGSFVAPVNGDVALFVNEAVAPWPFDRNFFYDGSARTRNTGDACVRVFQRAARAGGALLAKVTCPPLPTPAPRGPAP